MSKPLVDIAKSKPLTTEKIEQVMSKSIFKPFFDAPPLSSKYYMSEKSARELYEEFKSPDTFEVFCEKCDIVIVARLK